MGCGGPVDHRLGCRERRQPLEPDDPRDELRRQPDGVAVALDQPPVTPAELVGQPADLRYAAAGVDLPERPCDACVDGRSIGEPPRQRLVDQRESRRPIGRVADPLHEVTTEGAEYGVDGHRDVGEFVHRHADKPPGAQRRQIDLQATRGPVVADEHRPVGDACDERPEPQRSRVLTVRHRPARVEVDDHRDKRARQLADGRRIHRSCVEPLVAQHHTAKCRMRGAGRGGHAHTDHARPRCRTVHAVRMTSARPHRSAAVDVRHRPDHGPRQRCAIPVGQPVAARRR